MTSYPLVPLVGLGVALLAAGCFDDSKSKHPCDECLECEECLEGDNGVVQCAAISHHAQRCVDGDLHWFDSCGYEGAIGQDCPEQNVKCVNLDSATAECRCLNQARQ